jgi:hypothetical protein
LHWVSDNVLIPFEFSAITEKKTSGLGRAAAEAAFGNTDSPDLSNC